ncbi:MAG: hypothetical protein PHD48_12470 [Alphaproteobacteria bacterium]|nr:hypothetical protein [Alphaproteobacteria bacterium]
MEKHIFNTPTHYDLKNRGCTEEELDSLCEIFERLMLEQANGSLRKGVYDLKEFESAEQLKVADFTLTMERHEHPDGPEWKGAFEAESRSMEVWGTVEPTAA